MSKRALRVSDLPIGKTKAYEEIRAGRLRAVKCGKLTFILALDYERWLESLPPIKSSQLLSKNKPSAAPREALHDNG